MRTILAVCALALPIPVVAAGCGGDDEGGGTSSNGEDPQTVLDETFGNDETVTSGNLSLNLSGSVEGSQSGSVEASLSGPFQGDAENPAAIPQLDWSGSLSGEAAGVSTNFEGGLVVTADNAYVEYGGGTYEVGADIFGQFKDLAEQAAAQQQDAAEGQSFGEAFKQGCEAQLQAAGGDTTACDVDFQSWLGELTNEGTEEIEGTDSIHISGTLNVDTMLQGLVELGVAADPSTTAEADEVQQAADAVEDASFDLYAGVDDKLLRGIDFNISVDPSAIPEAADEGIESIDGSLSMRLGAVNEEQTIEAPADAQPIDDLLSQFGLDSSSLGGLGALGGGLDPTPDLGGSSGGSSNGGGGPTSPDDADAYLDCVANATTPDEINACASEL